MKHLLSYLALLLACFTLSPLLADSFIAVSTVPGAEIETKLQKFVFEQTGQNPRPLIVETDILDESGSWAIERNEMRGVIYHSLPGKTADSIIESIRGKWKAQGYSSYKTNLSFDDSWSALYDLAIVKQYSDYELLKIYDVSGINYDITNEKVIDQIQAWRKGIDIYFVTFDHSRFEAKIIGLNYDTKTLAKENYELCPDVIEQGYDSMENLIRGINQTKLLWCWWD